MRRSSDPAPGPPADAQPTASHPGGQSLKPAIPVGILPFAFLRKDQSALPIDRFAVLSQLTIRDLLIRYKVLVIIVASMIY